MIDSAFTLGEGSESEVLVVECSRHVYRLELAPLLDLVQENSRLSKRAAF